jgi:hypothetical protein
MAKSKGGRGGRRKGAGRPRITKTGKTSYFSTRITPETRALLETEARRGGLSLSTTVERLLRLGLYEKEKLAQENPLRAIFYLMGLLAERIPAGLGADPKYNWRTNPFMFEAFSVAVQYLLSALQPPGEVVAPPPPPPLPEWPPEAVRKYTPLEVAAARERAEFFHGIRFPTFDTPERRGRDVAKSLLIEMQYHGVLAAGTPQQRYGALQPDLTRQVYGEKVADTLTRLHYGLADAQRDLGIDTARDY